MSATVELIIKAVDSATDTVKEVLSDLDEMADKGGTLSKIFQKFSKDSTEGIATLVLGVRTLIDESAVAEAAYSKLSSIFTKMIITGAAMVATQFLPIKQAADFERQMSKVRAVMDEISEETFKEMIDLAQEMGAKTRYTATEAGEALQFLAMAGFDAYEAMKALPGVLQLAAAGGIELARAADIATSVLRGMALPIEQLGRVNDVLASAAAKSNSEVSELGDALKIAGPAAMAAGVALEEVVAIVGGLSNAGIKGAEAGTDIRRMLIRLVQPAKDVKELLDQMGVATTTAGGKFRGLAPILEDLAKSNFDLAKANQIFDQYAAAAAVAAVSQASTIKNLRSEMDNAAGAAARMAQVMEENLHGAFIELSGAVESFWLSVIRPLLGSSTTFIKAVVEIVRAATSITTAMGSVIPAFFGVSAVIGALLISLGLLGHALFGIVILFGKLSLAKMAASAVLKTYIGSTTLAIAKTIALNTTLGFLQLGFLSLVGTIKMVWDAMSATPLGRILALITIYTALKVAINALIPSWTKLATENKQLLKQYTDIQRSVEGLIVGYKAAAKGSEEQKEAAKELNKGLLSVAAANKIVSKEATDAANSINLFTGELMDGGAALDAFYRKVQMGRLTTLQKDIKLMADQFKYLSDPQMLDAFWREGGPISFMQRVLRLSKDTKPELDRLGKALGNAAKEFLIVAEEAGKFDTALGVGGLSAFMDQLGIMEPVLRSVFRKAYQQILIDREKISEREKQIIARGLDEQVNYLRGNIDDQLKELDKLVGKYNEIKEAAKTATIEPPKPSTEGVKRLVNVYGVGEDAIVDVVEAGDKKIQDISNKTAEARSKIIEKQKEIAASYKDWNKVMLQDADKWSKDMAEADEYRVKRGETTEEDHALELTNIEHTKNKRILDARQQFVRDLTKSFVQAGMSETEALLEIKKTHGAIIDDFKTAEADEARSMAAYTNAKIGYLRKYDEALRQFASETQKMRIEATLGGVEKIEAETKLELEVLANSQKMQEIKKRNEGEYWARLAAVSNAGQRKKNALIISNEMELNKVLSDLKKKQLDFETESLKREYEEGNIPYKQYLEERAKLVDREIEIQLVELEIAKKQAELAHDKAKVREIEEKMRGLRVEQVRLKMKIEWDDKDAKKDAADKVKSTRDEIAKMYAEQLPTDQLSGIKERNRIELEEFDRMWEEKIKIVKEANDKLGGLDGEIKDMEEKREIARGNLIKAHDEALNEKRLALAKSFADQMESTFADMYEATGKKRKELFYLEKAAAIASSIIATYEAAANALKTQPAWLGIAMAALITAQGMAKVAIIASQRPEGFSEGGPVRKGRARKRDDVLIRVSKEEYVLNDDAVRYYGLPFIDALNRRLISLVDVKRISYPRMPIMRPAGAYASGGQVMMEAPVNVGGGGGPQEVQIVNVLDIRSEMDKYFATSQGKKAIVNVIGATNRTVRRVLR